MSTWIQTATGLKVEPLALTPAMVSLEDIAHSLAFQCRYAGHTRWHYSVAQHCCLIHDELQSLLPEDEHWKTWAMGLLHDATEAYLVDLPRPVKKALPGYQKAEADAAKAIAQAFDLESLHSPLIKSLDTRILSDEREALMVDPPEPWAASWLGLGVLIERWSPERAREEFRLRALALELHGLTNPGRI